MSEPYRSKFVQDGKAETFYAWRVTRESAEDIAIWCGGRADSIHHNSVYEPFVTVYDTVNRPETAMPGDWVVKFSTDLYYRVLDDPVFQTLVHGLGATLFEAPREALVKPLTIDIVYENGQWVHYNDGVKTVFGVIYSETMNAPHRFKTNNEGES